METFRWKKKKPSWGSSGQGGGVGTLHLLAQPKEGQQQFKNKKQPELTENQTSRKSNNQENKEETFIQTGRRGRDGQPGQTGLMAKQLDPETWWIVEWTGQAVQQLADPAAPHSHIDKPGGEVVMRNRLQPRAPAQGNKASNLWLKTPMGVEAAAGETPSLTGEFVGETHRGLERAQTHLLGNQH